MVYYQTNNGRDFEKYSDGWTSVGLHQAQIEDLERFAINMYGADKQLWPHHTLERLQQLIASD